MNEQVGVELNATNIPAGLTNHVSTASKPRTIPLADRILSHFFFPRPDIERLPG